MVDKEKIILKITFVIAFFVYSFWEYIKENFGFRLFYPGIALCFVGYTYVIYSLFKRLSKFEKKLNKIISVSYIIFLSTINNFIDELFFDPTKIELNEYIGFIIIILITFYNERNESDRKKRNL